eukprot:4024509-Pyramimonas_sp.AAC.1
MNPCQGLVRREFGGRAEYNIVDGSWVNTGPPPPAPPPPPPSPPRTGPMRARPILLLRRKKKRGA